MSWHSILADHLDRWEGLVAQGRQLSRIEALLQELARAPHRQRMDPR